MPDVISIDEASQSSRQMSPVGGVARPAYSIWCLVSWDRNRMFAVIWEVTDDIFVDFRNCDENLAVDTSGNFHFSGLDCSNEGALVWPLQQRPRRGDAPGCQQWRN